ncbi:MAG: hypothetical protein QM621_11955 [Aeromicrobium sp.]|uniref:hypothetical protein n=1 Tax=Aeromicrobium sp. TaxID=1871063 RepID=UPI0039E6A879
MGFSLIFMRCHGDDQLDADCDGLARFLDGRRLRLAPSDDGVHHLTGPDGDLAFDGRWSDSTSTPSTRSARSAAASGTPR